jgi:hypothetical protein
MTSSCHAQLASGNWRAPRGQLQGRLSLPCHAAGLFCWYWGKTIQARRKNMFDKHQNAHPSCARTLSEGQLLDEISWFEARLNAIGGNGDCAYEKALARSYEQAVSSHRERLASLRQVNS